MRDIGYQLGLELANTLHSLEVKSLISELGDYWKRNQIGEMSWEDGSEG
ncbi:MAG: hypothetical protein JRN52_08010 [Nitrososphaerota archaeon]|nr:hypothetical protein [Nitrososphaerota archaeon]